jgi:YfiH family protein
MAEVPQLVRRVHEGVAWHTDPVLLERHGVLVAFSERTGGVSAAPFASLNLAGHVGDDPSAVDVNRTRLLEALGIAGLRHRLTGSEQVHGDRVAEVAEEDAGSGAFETAPDERSEAGVLHPRLPAADALFTAVERVPLFMCYADCVPVVLVAPEPVRAVAVVHAGWRGALSRLPGKAVSAMASVLSVEPSAMVAYIGPHVCEACYEVGDEVVSQFREEFATIRLARDRMDLGAVVSGALSDAGLPVERQCRLEACTAQRTDAFYSYRAEGVTGRHAALAAVL